MRRIIVLLSFIGLVIVFSIILNKSLFLNNSTPNNSYTLATTTIIYIDLRNKSSISTIDYNNTEISIVLNPKDLYIRPFIVPRIEILEIIIKSARGNNNDVTGLILYIALQSSNGSLIHVIPKPIKIDTDKIVYQVPLVQGIGSLVIFNNDINEKRLNILFLSKELY
ncbi:hypothetical protein Igag_1517 [Ignisphaera aggregans DSM 17230]|uniref:Uncharacterized protein n=1 Tax=Ignisphaera aggregans (strain DSM 17230 / JCM 13409 / AQ1.S1) TaxID=583356 RepID=E0SQY9_IGNAA|nr:hypothetical protein Igag_1517 [Ignisphaera aggregans DSM 17230]